MFVVFVYGISACAYTWCVLPMLLNCFEKMNMFEKMFVRRESEVGSERVSVGSESVE